MGHMAADPARLTLERLGRMVRRGAITPPRASCRARPVWWGRMAAAEALVPALLEAQASAKREIVIGQSGDVSRLDPTHERGRERHRGVVQLVRQSRQSPRGQPALPGAGHGVETPESDHVAVRHPPEREVPQRRSVDRQRREVQHRADVRPEGQDLCRLGVQHGGAGRHAERHHGARRHEEAGPTPAGSPGVLWRPDHSARVFRAGRTRRVQREAGREWSGPVRLLGQGRSPDRRRQPRATGAASRKPTGSSSGRFRTPLPGSRPCSEARSI